MNREEKRAWFRQELLFDVLPALPPDRGVVLDWGRLPGVLATGLSTLKPISDDVIVLAPGDAQRAWVYGRGDDRLMLQVRVFVAGHKRAQDALIERGVMTMRPDVPYTRGPARLGDVAASMVTVPGREAIFWVFENVLAEVKNIGCDVNVEALARQMQSFMQPGVVSSVRGALPGLSLSSSATRLEVGETMKVHVELPKGTSREDLTSTIVPRPGDDQLELVTFDGFSAELRASSPGTTAVEARLAHHRTLVSPDDLTVKVEVVAPPPRLVPTGEGGAG